MVKEAPTQTSPMDLHWAKLITCLLSLSTGSLALSVLVMREQRHAGPSAFFIGLSLLGVGMEG